MLPMMMPPTAFANDMVRNADKLRHFCLALMLPRRGEDEL